MITDGHNNQHKHTSTAEKTWQFSIACYVFKMQFQSVYVPVAYFVDGMHYPLDVILGSTARFRANRSRHDRVGEPAVLGAEGRLTDAGASRIDQRVL